ncbi:MAG: hypothetical protein K2N19_04740 [Muribaculaceae bacterium]|nr:hypothetical protein [Muribaculaceae bacterium]
MKFLVFILILISLWLIFGRAIRAWIQRRAEEKLADFLRAQMGMPSAKEQRKAQKAAEKAARRNGESSGSYWTRPAQPRQPRYPSGSPIIPKEYAVDVEFTEIREFQQTTILDSAAAKENSSSTSSHRKRIKEEGQVSDVEYTDI